MSIATTVRTAGPFAGTGSLVALPFAFKVFAASDLVVQRTNAAGDVATLTLTTHYSVSLNADQDTSPGGTVTLVTALAVGETAALTSGVSATQPLQLASGGPFLPGQIEDALDRAMIVVQQQGVLGEQTLRVPLGETALILPIADQRANKALLFDADGDPYLAAPASGSAADVMLQYASTAPGKGAALVGVQDAAGDWSGLNQEEVNAEIGFLLIRSGDRLNALSAFSASEQAAIMAKTSTTDHQAQISDLLGNNRHVHFPRGRYNGSAAITITNTLHISGDPFAELRFTDGAYTALSFTSGSAARSKIENIFIRGTASAAPTVTLVRMDTAAGYSTISGCWFAYADLCLDLDGVYITSVYDNIFAVAKRYWRLEDSTFGTAANQFWGNKYGTPIAGNIADLIYIAAPGVTMFGEYWETQQHGCTALHLATGAVRAEVSGKLEVCGDIVIDTSVEAHLKVNMDNCWKTTSNWAVRVNGGANAYIGNSSIRLSALDAALTGISAAGGAAVSATDVRNFGSGVVLSSVGGVRGSQIRGCSTGVTFTSGSTAVLGVDNTFISNTTNVVNNSGGSAIAPGNFTATLTGCTTSPTGGARYEVDNGIVALTVPGLTGTSNTTDCTLTGLPAAIQPVGAVFGTVALVLDNGVRSSEQCSISGGTLTLYRNDSATGFTASGTKGIRACVVTYRLRNV